MATNWKIFLVAGFAAAMTVALLFRTGKDDREQQLPAIAAPTPDQQLEPLAAAQPQPTPAIPEPTPGIDLAELANDPAIADAPEFNDANYPEPVDDLLVIERGDPSRYITPQDREEDLARRQRAQEASLQVAQLVGDERIRALATLGAYAGDGNDDAADKLREILTSRDDDMRADALDAVAELLPASGTVPAFTAEPLTDEQADLILQALQQRSGS